MQGQREGPALPTPDSVCALAVIEGCSIHLLHPMSSPLFPVSNQGTQEASAAPADKTWKGNWPKRANGWFPPWLLPHSCHSDQAPTAGRQAARAGQTPPSTSTTAPRTTGPCKAPALTSSQLHVLHMWATDPREPCMYSNLLPSIRAWEPLHRLLPSSHFPCVPILVTKYELVWLCCTRCPPKYCHQQQTPSARKEEGGSWTSSSPPVE